MSSLETELLYEPETTAFLSQKSKLEPDKTDGPSETMVNREAITAKSEPAFSDPQYSKTR